MMKMMMMIMMVMVMILQINDDDDDDDINNTNDDDDELEHTVPCSRPEQTWTVCKTCLAITPGPVTVSF